MKALLKTLGIITVTTLTLGSGLAQADSSVVKVRFGAGNPYLAASYGGLGPHEHHYRDGLGPYRPGMQPRGGFHGQLEMRQERQLERIELGVARGEITRREAAKLFHEQREIERLQRHFIADGHLSRAEYTVLDEALDQAGQHIRHQANDNEWRW